MLLPTPSPRPPGQQTDCPWRPPGELSAPSLFLTSSFLIPKESYAILTFSSVHRSQSQDRDLQAIPPPRHPRVPLTRPSSSQLPFQLLPTYLKKFLPLRFFFLCAFQLCTRQIKVDMFLKDLMTQQYQRQGKLYIWDHDWNFKKMVKPIKIPKHSQKILKFLLLILSTSTPFFGHGQL